MDEDQAAAELDQILARSKSRAAASAVKRKIRMPEEDIAFIMSWKRVDIPSDDDFELGLLRRRYLDLYTPEKMEWTRRDHEEVEAMVEARQAEIMRELGDKGYVETDEVDQTYIDEINEWIRVQSERREIKSHGSHRTGKRTRASSRASLADKPRKEKTL